MRCEAAVFDIRAVSKVTLTRHSTARIDTDDSEEDLKAVFMRECLAAGA